MKLAGEIRVPDGGETKAIPLAATAADKFSERILTAGTNGCPIEGGPA